MNLQRTAESLFQKFKSKKILVVGDVGVDRYTQGSVDRISPEAPVPIVLVESERLKLGLAANVADNLVALGATPVLVGVVGKDRGAEDFRALLKKTKISDATLIEDKSRRTILKERVLTDSQQLLRVDYETTEPMAEKTRRDVYKAVKAALPSVHGVIVQDYHKGIFDRKLMQDVIHAAREAGKPVFADPHRATAVDFYRGVDVLTPNRKEAESLSGHADWRQAGPKILLETNARHVVVTLGKDGMAIFHASHKGGVSKADEIPTVAREVFDVSGAGDTVISVLALAQVCGADIKTAAKLANVAAGIEVAKPGTATVSPREILDFLK